MNEQTYKIHPYLSDNFKKLILAQNRFENIKPHNDETHTICSFDF